MLGRVQAGRLLGDRRRLSGWGGAGRLQAAGVGAGVFFASASLPLSLRASSAAGLVSVPLGVLLSVPMLGRGCGCWAVLCGCASAGALWQAGRGSLGFHPLKYLNDEQNR